MVKVGVYNEDGEPLGFEYVYDDDPADWQDEYDREVDDDDECCPPDGCCTECCTEDHYGGEIDE